MAGLLVAPSPAAHDRPLPPPPPLPLPRAASRNTNSASASSEAEGEGQDEEDGVEQAEEMEEDEEDVEGEGDEEEGRDEEGDADVDDIDEDDIDGTHHTQQLDVDSLADASPEEVEARALENLGWNTEIGKDKELFRIDLRRWEAVSGNSPEGRRYLTEGTAEYGESSPSPSLFACADTRMFAPLTPPRAPTL